MIARQRAWPRLWLMTDERLGDGLWAAISRLPAGEAGVVFRHHATAPEERRSVALLVAEACRARQLVVAVAANCALAQELGADLVHNPRAETDLPFSMSVHTLQEAESARDGGAALAFVSPVHATRSHPRQPPLGPAMATQLARAARIPAIALGGMNAAAFAALPAGVFHGWAAIDAWTSEGSA